MEHQHKTSQEIVWQDHNGYPSEEAIAWFKKYDFAKGSLDEFLSNLRKTWWASDWGFILGKTKLELHTAGWSGNEELIVALQENFMFWFFYGNWQSIRRGGHYYFKLRRSMSEGKLRTSIGKKQQEEEHGTSTQD